MLPTAIRARINADVRRRRRDRQPGLRELVVDGHVEHERIARLRMDPRPHLDAALVAGGEIPWAPAKQAMDGVVLLRLRQRGLVALPVEFKAAVGEPVGPRNQNRAMASVSHAVDGKRLDHVATAEAVFAQCAADLYDDRHLIVVTQFELLAGGPDLALDRHNAMIPEPQVAGAVNR